MKAIPPQAFRNSVRMPDGTYRTVPSAQEVGSYLDLRHRTFPDGTSRLSVSARGLWTICLNGVFFPQWSKTMLTRLADMPGAFFAEGGRAGDIFVDAAEVSTAIGHSSSKRGRAAVALVEARRVEDAVKLGVRSEMLAISAMTGPPSRARIRKCLDSEAVGQASPTNRITSGLQSDQGSTDELEADAGDLALLVPIVEREVGGRTTPSVNARDAYSVLGVGRGFSHWFRDEAARAALVHGDSYEDASPSPTGSFGTGRPRKDYVLSLDAAKEIVRIVPGMRARRIWTYLVESECRAHDAVIPVPPDECGREIRMEDCSVRLVLGRASMEARLAIMDRPFAVGASVLSFSLRGIWECTRTRRLFPSWSERVTCSLLQGTDYVRVRAEGADPDVVVDVDAALRAFGFSFHGSVRAAFDLIAHAAHNARQVRERAKALSEAREALVLDLRSIAGMPAGLDRTRRLGDVLGMDYADSLVFSTTSEVGQVDEAAGDLEPSDFARFVPVFEHEIGGVLTQSVNARDVHLLLGGGYLFANWIKEQVAKAKLSEGKDFRKVLSKTGNNLVGGRPRVEYLLTMDAAQEIGMRDKGDRGKELRLYFIDCRRRLLEGSPAASGRPNDGGLSSTASLPPRPSMGMLDQSAIPLAMEEFLATKGVSDRVARVITSKHERALAALLLSGEAFGRCGMHPATRRLVFDVDALSFWWAEAEPAVFKAMLGVPSIEG